MGTKKTKRAKRGSAGDIVTFRLGKEIVGALDRHVERLNAAEPGRRATRSDALRALVLRAVHEIESAERAEKGGRS